MRQWRDETGRVLLFRGSCFENKILSYIRMLFFYFYDNINSFAPVP